MTAAPTLDDSISTVSSNHDDTRSPKSISLQEPKKTRRPSSALKRQFAKYLYERFGKPKIQIVFWDGTTLGDSAGRQRRIVIHAPQGLRRLIFDVDTGFGEAYMANEISIEGDMIDVLATVTRGMSKANYFNSLSSRLFRSYFGHTLARSRSNVEFHYDLGNEFFKLWLDKQCVYTCAYYQHAEASLEEAQVAKMDHICRKLRLKSGEIVAEAGCGWGTLALHMAQHYGVRVRAFNLSHEQLTYAREKARTLRLEKQVEFIEDDYRNIDQKCDAFVSVGMLEHVGKENYATMGRIINRILVPSGRGLIHTIGRNIGRLLDRWTVKYIFPEAYPPSLREMMDIFERNDFSVLDVENLRLHYAKTCAEWLARFERAIPQVEKMFDIKFVRMWRLYLAASSAGFQNGDLQLFQVLFARSDNNSLPLTRDDIYSTTV